MSEARTLTVGAEDRSIRLDRWFKRHFPELPHGRLERLLRTGQVRVDGRRAHSGDRLAPGQAIRVPPIGDPPEGAPGPGGPAGPRAVSAADSAMLQRAVLHRDPWLIALNKPAGLAVQGGTKADRHLDGLLDALRFGEAERPRLVHRLDKDTSGVLLLARTAAAAAFLTRAFREKTTRKLYWAITVGVPKLRQGRIDLALAKLPGRAGERVRADAEDGKQAVTLYKVIDTAGPRAAWLALRPITGRTHQLRAHCAAIGAPILGDGKYGGAGAHLAGVPEGRRLQLHARALSIPHPQGGRFEIAAPLPRHMAASWEFFGFEQATAAAMDWLDPPELAATAGMRL